MDILCYKLTKNKYIFHKNNGSRKVLELVIPKNPDKFHNYPDSSNLPDYQIVQLTEMRKFERIELEMGKSIKSPGE